MKDDNHFLLTADFEPVISLCLDCKCGGSGGVTDTDPWLAGMFSAFSFN